MPEARIEIYVGGAFKSLILIAYPSKAFGMSKMDN